jgi:hypothetical protein
MSQAIKSYLLWIIISLTLFTITSIFVYKNKKEKENAAYEREMKEYEMYMKIKYGPDNIYGYDLGVYKTQNGFYMYNKRYNPPDFILPFNPKPLRDTPPVKPN